MAWQPGPQRHHGLMFSTVEGREQTVQLSTQLPKIVAEASGGDMQRIREKSVRQTSRIIALAEEGGFELRTPGDANRRGGTVCMRMPNARELAEALNEANVACDYRPEAGIRVSPHFYTRDEEIEQAFEVIDRLRKGAPTLLSVRSVRT